MPGPPASRRRAVLERSATSTVVKTVPKAVPRPTYPTFLSSRSTRRTSWARDDSGRMLAVDTAATGKERRTNAASAGLDQAPRLTRKATYSSLPPSPTGAIRMDDDGLKNSSAHSPLEFASMSLGIDPQSDDVLAQAIRRIAGRRGSASSLDSADDRLRATSLPPEEFFSAMPTITTSLQSMPNLRRGTSDDEDEEGEGDTGSVGTAEIELSSPRSANSLRDGEGSADEEVFEDAFASHDSSSLENSMLLSGKPGNVNTFEDKQAGGRRLSWWDVLREAVVEEEEQALEIQGKW